jgi:hypothetical protein
MDSLTVQLEHSRPVPQNHIRRPDSSPVRHPHCPKESLITLCSLPTSSASRWYILNIVDLFLHEAELKTGYGYIIYDFFLSSASYATDILILAGTHQLISNQLNSQPTHQLRKNARTWYLTGRLIVLVQIILALYFLGSLFANEALWLQIADSSVIDGVASRKNTFEAAFFIIQFLFTLTMLTGAAISALLWWKEVESIPNVRKFICFLLQSKNTDLLNSLPRSTPTSPSL